MKRTRATAIALVAAAALALLTACGSSTSSPAPKKAAPRPRGALGYWQQIAFQPANLDAWWNGYTNRGNSTSLTGCRTTGRVTDCRIVSEGLTMGFAALGHYGPCRYEYVLSATSGANDLKRRFRYCG